MRKRRALVASVVCTLAAGAGAAVAATPLVFDLSTRVADHCALCSGEQITASGRVSGSSGRVRVQATECRYPGWHDVTSAQPDAEGRWSAEFHPPTSNAQVRVVWNGVRSAATRLAIRANVYFGQDVRHPRWFEINVSGQNFTGKRVTLDRFVDGTWRPFRTARLGRYASGYTMVRLMLNMPAGTPLRVRFNPRARCFEPGVSDVIVVKRLG